jgi:hypothetical protein
MAEMVAFARVHTSDPQAHRKMPLITGDSCLYGFQNRLAGAWQRAGFFGEACHHFLRDHVGRSGTRLTAI